MASIVFSMFPLPNPGCIDSGDAHETLSYSGEGPCAALRDNALVLCCSGALSPLWIKDEIPLFVAAVCCFNGLSSLSVCLALSPLVGDSFPGVFNGRENDAKSRS